MTYLFQFDSREKDFVKESCSLCSVQKRKSVVKKYIFAREMQWILEKASIYIYWAEAQIIDEGN